MKKKFILVTIILAILILLYASSKNNTQLPDSFTMNIHSDFTSSAATRTYDATVTFANKKLIQGNAIYSSGDTLGKERIVHCMITNQEWAATEIKDSCEFPFTTPATTKEGLELQIKNSELKPVNKTCGHDDLCYTLVQ